MSYHHVRAITFNNWTNQNEYNKLFSIMKFRTYQCLQGSVKINVVLVSKLEEDVLVDDDEMDQAVPPKTLPGPEPSDSDCQIVELRPVKIEKTQESLPNKAVPQPKTKPTTSKARHQ